MDSWNNSLRRHGQAILVTGAGGFVGQCLCRKLALNGAAITACVRNYTDAYLLLRQERNGITFREVPDIVTVSDWAPLLKRTDTVVHLAARAHVLRESALDPLREYRIINVESTLRLARQAANMGVLRFVFLSSVGVNGNVTLPGESFREENVPGPVTPYAVSKHEAEQGLLQLAAETGMEVVIIRPPLVYGPAVKGNFFAMMRWLARGVPLPLGAIHNQRSLVALDNLVDLIITCIDHPAAANQIFLVSDGEELSTTELLLRTAAALNRPARLFPVPQKIVIAGLRCLGKADLAQRLCGSLQVDSGKARRLLGWLPPVGVDEGLRKTAQYFREHQWS